MGGSVHLVAPLIHRGSHCGLCGREGYWVILLGCRLLRGLLGAPPLRVATATISEGSSGPSISRRSVYTSTLVPATLSCWLSSMIPITVRAALRGSIWTNSASVGTAPVVAMQVYYSSFSAAMMAFIS
jgi:hypothetical protein